MTMRQAAQARANGETGGVTAHSLLAFAAIGDHARLPWRFFARLQAADGSRLPL